MHGTLLDIRLLGPLEVRARTRMVMLPRSKKTRALLGYLAATGQAHGRAHLCDLLWDGPADPRAALRWSLSKLRRAVDGEGEARIVTEGDRVRLEPRGARIDLTAIRASLGAVPEEAPTAALEASAAPLRGEFLEGLDLPGCYRFDAWCSAQRAEARTLRRAVLRVLTHRLPDDPERALRYARERVSMDPLEEDAHVSLMEILAGSGAAGEAMEQYERCREILWRELGTRPAPSTEALRRKLQPERPSRATTAPRARAVIRLEPPAHPVVGRAAERAALEELLTSGSAGRVLVLRGEAGIGKTRLLEELASLVWSRGGEVLASRAFETERVRPYGPWIDLLRAIPRDEVPASLRLSLAPLLPELDPATSQIAAAAGAPERNRLFDAVARLLAGRAGDRMVVVVIDDLHWADESTAALLHFVARETAESRVRIACAARPPDPEDHRAADTVLRDLRKEQRLRDVNLAPLQAEDITRLVQRLDPSLDAHSVVAESEGNPLFAIELVRARQDGERALPGTLDGVIGERLSRLSEGARRILPWLAALGRDVDLEVLAVATEIPPSDLVAALEEFERRGILRGVDERYAFTHDLLRKVAYGRVSGPRRRLIHERVARALSAAGIPEGEGAEAVAYHAELGGDDGLAAEACVAAAWRCVGLFAYGEAAGLAARGMAHAQRLDRARSLPLRLRVLELYAHPGMRPHRKADIKAEVRSAIEEARATGAVAAEASGLYLVSILHYQTGEFGEALDNTLRAEEAGRDADPMTVVRTMSETARCLGLLESEIPRAERLATEARALTERVKLSPELHQIPMAFGLLRHHAGDLDAALTFFERAAGAAQQEGERWWENACLSRLVMIELERARPAEALARWEALDSVARQLGEGSDRPLADALRALALLMLDDAGARAALDLALEALRRADSRWMITYVESLAAELELRAGRIDAAAERAERALDAALVIRRPSAIALARALRARCTLERGDRDGAAEQLGPYRAGLAGPHLLSHRAREAVEDTARRLAKIPTQVPTPAPTRRS